MEQERNNEILTAFRRKAVRSLAQGCAWFGARLCVVWRMDVRSLGQIGTKLRLTAIFYRKNLQMRIFFRIFAG